MTDWDETSPADADIVSGFPANERTARAAVKTIFDVDHHSATGADQGKHEVIQIVDNDADPTITAGQVGLWNKDGVLRTRVGAGDATPVDAFASGTKLIFPQASAPTGWTQDNTVNDKVLRIVDNTGTGASTGGSWTISGISVDGHALTINEMPAHSHPGSTFPAGATGNDGGSAADRSDSNTNLSVSVASQGGGAAHTHTLTIGDDWRPAYVDAIVASKD